MLQHSIRETVQRLVSSRRKPVEPDFDIVNTEPAMFIPTYTNKPAVLRGCCILKLKEPLPVKRLIVNLRGVSRLQWSLGRRDMKTLADCTLVLFGPNSPTETTQLSSNAAHIGKPGPGCVKSIPSQKKCRVWNAIHKKFCARRTYGSCADYQILPPGTYQYNFEMILPSHLPESICLRRSNVHYNVQACVEQPGCLSRSIKRSKSVTAVHCPAEDFVEDSEPVYVCRRWRNSLRCEIILSRRGAPLGDRLPVSVYFREIAFSRCERFRIFLSENTQYLQKSGISSCGGPFKRVLLYDAGQDFEDGADAQGYPDNMVRGRSLMEDAGSASAKSEDEGTRLDVNLLLPQAVSQTHPNTDEKLNMHFDTKYKNVQISHWLEFVFTVSRPDARSVQKIVRAPLALRSSYALPANASLPAYSHTCDGKPICVSATESIDG